MRWVYSLCLAVCLAILASAASADNQEARRDAQTLLDQQQCQLEVILGRVIFRSGSPAKGQHRQQSEHSSETLTVSSQPGGPSLHYIRDTGDESLLLDIFNGDSLRLEWRAPGADAAKLVVVQPSDGSIVVELSHRNIDERLTAASFWHLQAEHPALFTNYVQPLFTELGIVPHGGWSSHDLDGQLRRLLEVDREVLEHEEFRALISQLGHDSRSLRIAAQRRLLQQGVSLLPRIAALRDEHLDSEQRARLVHIRRSLAPVDADGVERVAQWLATDRAYWTALAQNWKPADRIAADRYLRDRIGKGLPAEVLDSGVRVADGSAAGSQRR